MLCDLSLFKIKSEDELHSKVNKYIKDFVNEEEIQSNNILLIEISAQLYENFIRLDDEKLKKTSVQLLNLYGFYSSMKKRSFLYKWREQNIKLKYFHDILPEEESCNKDKQKIRNNKYNDKNDSEDLNNTNQKQNKTFKNSLTNSMINVNNNIELEEDKVKTFNREYKKENLNNSNIITSKMNTIDINTKNNFHNLSKSKKSNKSMNKQYPSKNKIMEENKNINNNSYRFKDGNNKGIKNKNKTNNQVSIDQELHKLSTNLEFDYSEYFDNENKVKIKNNINNPQYKIPTDKIDNRNNYIDKYELNKNSSREKIQKYNFDDEMSDDNFNEDLHYSTKLNNLKRAEKENDTFNKLYIDSLKKDDNFLFNKEILDIKNKEECSFIPNIKKS